MTSPVPIGALYHTGIVVQDVDAAKQELTDLLGTEWGLESEAHVPVWFPDRGADTMHFKLAYSTPGPHRLELVSETPGTLWTATPRGSAHHLGFWCDDLAAASAEMSRRGVPLRVRVGASDEHGDAYAVYHEAASGLYIELVTIAMKAHMFPEEA